MDHAARSGKALRGWKLRPRIRHGLAKARPLAARLELYLRGDSEPLVVADWPEDIAHLSILMVTGSGYRTALPKFVFELLDLPLFHAETLSDLPRNCQHDARALRD